jgi:hypothetical protein
MKNIWGISSTYENFKQLITKKIEENNKNIEKLY